MQYLLWAIAVVCVVVALGGMGLAGYSRLMPLPAARLADHPGPQGPGLHALKGGTKVVLPLAQLPEDGVEKLLDLIRQTPRTNELVAPDGHSFVTRSRLFGFPDIIRVWRTEGLLHIHSHLVIGTSDLGVNAARVDAWLKAL